MPDRSAVAFVRLRHTFVVRVDLLLFALGSSISRSFSLAVASAASSMVSAPFVDSIATDGYLRPFLSFISAATAASLVSTSHLPFCAFGAMPRRPSVPLNDRMNAYFVLARSLVAIRTT